jgi:energy-converting hydrogenase B subunit D
MLVMQITVLVFVAITGLGVVLTRQPARQAIAISFYGILLALMFFIYQAPDVALSQLVIGAVALPLMVLLALAKARRVNAERAQQPQPTPKPEKRAA